MSSRPGAIRTPLTTRTLTWTVLIVAAVYFLGSSQSTV